MFNMERMLEKLTIRGFKSIESLDDFALEKLNVLIGANGTGKSNFVDFFRLLRSMAEEGLARYVLESGGADGFFFLGPKYTHRIFARLEFGEAIYEVDLAPTAGDEIMVADERVQSRGSVGSEKMASIGGGSRESRLKAGKSDKASHESGDNAPGHIYDALSSWTVYHFHDTSKTAPMRRRQSAHDWRELRPDASNIAAFLLNLKKRHDNVYSLVRDTIRLIAPFFDDFILEPEERGGEEKIWLQWTQKGSGYPFQPNQFSDGTIRFICLATALLQPAPPSAIVIDEPELGLHPYAITLLSDLIHAAAERTQLVVSTQSPTLLDHFEPDKIIVVSRQKGRSTLARLNTAELEEWLAEYSIIRTKPL